MDWGIVASVIVGLVMFILGVAVIAISLFTLMARGMKKTIAAGGVPKCPMPGCPVHGNIEAAMKSAKSES